MRRSDPMDHTAFIDGSETQLFGREGLGRQPPGGQGFLAPQAPNE